jgi:hypothetical protein
MTSFIKTKMPFTSPNRITPSYPLVMADQEDLFNTHMVEKVREILPVADSASSRSEWSVGFGVLSSNRDGSGSTSCR